MATRTVYVVAWIHEDGVGFNWFYVPRLADIMFGDQAPLVMHRQNQRWTAFRFDFDTDGQTHQEITTEIADGLIALCREAERRIGPIEL